MFLFCGVLLNEVNTSKVTKTLFRKNISRLRCIILCWIATGCGHGYETGEKIPYAYSYSYSYVRLNKRIEAYKVLIDACKEHMVLEARKESFNIENITYKELEKEHRKFALIHHPDKGGNTAIFQTGSGAWGELQEKLKKDGLNLQYLKGVSEPLLTHLKTHHPQ